MLTVTLILGIVAAAAVPMFSSPDPRKVELAAAELGGALRFARAESIRTGDPHGVRTIAGENRVRVFRLDTGSNPPTPVYDVRDPMTGQLYDIDLDRHPFTAGVSLQSESHTFHGGCADATAIVFDGRGLPTCRNPLTAILEHGVFTLVAGSASRTLTVHGYTGRVTVP